MSTSTNHLKLGAFILGAGALLVVALLFFGIFRAFRPQVVFETYFNESVQGLEVGSRVKLRGVTVGTVRRIALTAAEYELDRPVAERRPFVLVEVALDERDLGPEIGRDTEAQVRRGMRIRLSQLGITGVSFLELDFVDPARNPPLAVPWTPRHPHIPSMPSRLNRLFESTEKFFQKLESVDVALVLTNVNAALVAVKSALDGADTAAISGQLTNFLAELRATNHRLADLLAQPGWKELPAEAGQTLARARETLASLQEQLEMADLASVTAQATDTLRQLQTLASGRDGEIDEILSNLAALTENLRALSELARKYPSFLLLGEPPQPKPNKP
ncbi:MAG: MlaD family protein [Limisphaerales bacterium]